MLDRVFFDKCFLNLLTFHQVPIDAKKTDALYLLMGKDFDNKEFSDICGDICRHENLYGKYPTPPMFYTRQVKMDARDLRFKACEAFCDKVQNYLLSGFVPDFEKQLFKDGLNETEQAVLRRHGGISTLWAEVNRDCFPRSLAAVMKELREDFETRYQVQEKMACLGIESLADEAALKQVAGLVDSCVRRIGRAGSLKERTGA